MKRKCYLCLIAVVMVLAAGCGKEKTDSSLPTSVSVVESETGSSQTEDSSADSSTVEVSTSVNVVVDETGVYPETSGITELGLGIDTVACTIKVPLNYIMAGATILKDGAQQSIEGLGATTTVESAVKDGNVSDELAIYSLGITSLDADPTRINLMMYDASSVGDMAAIKAMYPDGKEVGDDTMPGWVYKTTNNPDADFAMVIQTSDNSFLNLYYQGPVVDEVGEDEMAQRVYNLVTKK